MSWDPGFDKNTVQNTGIINQGKSTDVGLGKETKFRIVLTEVQDVGFLVKKEWECGIRSLPFQAL